MRYSGMTNLEIEMRDNRIRKLYLAGTTMEQLQERFKVNDRILKRVLKPCIESEQELKEYARCKEETQFLATLDSFSNTIHKINDKAADGASMKEIRTNMLKTVKAYSVLIGIAQEEKKTVKKAENRAKVVNGWVMCPACKGKTVKAGKNTHFENLPIFCKWCKKEFIADL